MRSALLALALAPFLAGCPALDILEGKESPYKTAHEQQVAAVTAVEPEPKAVVVEVPQPITPVEPECVPVFRVVVCP